MSPNASSLTLLPSGTGQRGHARFGGRGAEPTLASLVGMSGWRTRHRKVCDVGLGGLGVRVPAHEAHRVRVGETVTVSLVLDGHRHWITGRVRRIGKAGSHFWSAWHLGVSFDPAQHPRTELALRGRLWRLPLAA